MIIFLQISYFVLNCVIVPLVEMFFELLFSTKGRIVQSRAVILVRRYSKLHDPKYLRQILRSYIMELCCDTTDQMSDPLHSAFFYEPSQKQDEEKNLSRLL